MRDRMHVKRREHPMPRFEAAVLWDRQHSTAKERRGDVVRMALDARAQLSELECAEPKRQRGIREARAGDQCR